MIALQLRMVFEISHQKYKLDKHKDVALQITWLWLILSYIIIYTSADVQQCLMFAENSLNSLRIQLQLQFNTHFRHQTIAKKNSPNLVWSRHALYEEFEEFRVVVGNAAIV